MALIVKGTPDRDVRETEADESGVPVAQGAPGPDPWLVEEDGTPHEEGTWDYQAGVSSPGRAVPANGRVLGITAASSQPGASIRINGGDVIPIPVPSSGVGAIDIAPRGNLVAPTIVYTNCDSYFVEFITPV